MQLDKRSKLRMLKEMAGFDLLQIIAAYPAVS